MEGNCRLLELKEGLILRIHEADIENEAGEGCSSRALDECQHRANVALSPLVCWPCAGAVIWDAGLVLAHYLVQLQDTGYSFVSKQVLELGSGTPSTMCRTSQIQVWP